MTWIQLPRVTPTTLDTLWRSLPQFLDLQLQIFVAAKRTLAVANLCSQLPTCTLHPLFYFCSYRNTHTHKKKKRGLRFAVAKINFAATKWLPFLRRQIFAAAKKKESRLEALTAQAFSAAANFAPSFTAVKTRGSFNAAKLLMSLRNCLPASHPPFVSLLLLLAGGWMSGGQLRQ